MNNELIPIQIIENKIFLIRGQRVMLDSDLAELYGVETKRLNEAVKRNIERFPAEFMFQLSNNEWDDLRSQFATFDKVIRKYKPYVFTEYGVLMLSNILNSKKAIAVSIQIIKVFTKLRELALTNKEVFQRLDELERKLISHARDNNADIEELFKQIGYLHDITKPKQIGFNIND